MFVSNNKVIGEKHTLVSTVECKKDTSQVLKDSGVAASINHSLKHLKATSKIPLKGVLNIAQRFIFGVKIV